MTATTPSLPVRQWRTLLADRVSGVRCAEIACGGFARGQTPWIRHGRGITRAALLAMATLGFTLHASAQTTVNLIDVADTTIFSSYPDNNFGESTLEIGANGAGAPGRALVQFDLSSIPAGATITSAQMTMSVVKIPPGDQRAAAVDSDYDLYMMQVPWVEGTGSGNSGTLAQPGESTWNERGADGFASWGAPGGLSGTDFADFPSTSASVGTTYGPIYWGSTDSFVANVQSWLNDPADNFGCILISDGEGTPGTARRLASRETASGSDVPPTLTVTYTIPEPSSALLLVTGALCGVTWKRRTRRVPTLG